MSDSSKTDNQSCTRNSAEQDTYFQDVEQNTDLQEEKFVLVLEVRKFRLILIFSIVQASPGSSDTCTISSPSSLTITASEGENNSHR